MPKTFREFAGVAFLLLGSGGAAASCPEHSHIKPGTENLSRVICNCDDGYEKQEGRCQLFSSMRPESKFSQLKPQIEGPGRLTTEMDRALRLSMNIFPGDNGPRAMEARCSEFVRIVSERLGVDERLRTSGNGDANSMAEYVAHSANWRLVEGDRAQELASRGTFVLAVSANKAGHGHVAIVAPIPSETRRPREEPLVRDGNIHHQATGSVAHSTYGAVAANKAFSAPVSYYEYVN